MIQKAFAKHAIIGGAITEEIVEKVAEDVSLEYAIFIQRLTTSNDIDLKQ